MPEIWSDSPIKSRTEDAFDRASYAAQAARLIAASHSWKDSIVFGLTGPWGSGKSSMLAMITEELEQSSTHWSVARFTPWATGDVSGLLEDFYASLSSALPKDQRQKLRSALGTLAQVAAPAANAIPWAGAAVAAAAQTGGEALKQRPSWDVAFRRASDRLTKFGTPVLLIADDIDRLQTDELLALLKVVRLLGRFPGVHYLLAYDETTLHQTLSAANLATGSDDAAARFMEKIVQYPLVVPPLSSSQLLSRLDRGIDLALADAGRRDIVSARLNGLVPVFLSQLATPRAIDRFLAQLRHHLPLVHQHEIDDEDVIILTLLRTTFPTLYMQLPRWRRELVTGHTDEVKRGSSSIEYEPFDVDTLLRTVSKRSQSDARALLHNLFPSTVRQSQWNRGSSTRRVCNDRYFDRYFAMGIPTDDVSDVEVTGAVREATDGDARNLQRLLSGVPDRVQLVLEKAYAVSAAADADPTDTQRLALSEALLQMLDDIPDKESNFSSPRERAVAWVGAIVGGISDHASTDSIVALLEAAARPGQAIEVLSFSRHWDPRPTWADEVVDHFCHVALAAFHHHMCARDDANLQDLPGTLIHFLRENGRTENLQDVIRSGLGSGQFSVEDLAARFARTSRLLGVPGAKWQLREFGQDDYEVFAPATDNPLYSASIEDLDLTDLSWKNRRAFVRGRVRKPGASNRSAGAESAD